MKSAIISCLRSLGASDYLITEKNERSSELFYIKRSLDMTRFSEKHSYKVVVYRDFSDGGKNFRGSSSVNIYPQMTEAEVSKTLSDAYLAAGFVRNPAYTLPAPSVSALVEMPSDISDVSSEEACRIMSEALFAEDSRPDVFLNSAELFLTETLTSISGSQGTEVSYRKWSVWGEFVAQCKKPLDVETYQSFRYDSLNTAALRQKVSRTLDYTLARTKASSAAPAGNYRLILSDNYMRTFFDYYTDRTSSGVKFAHYVDYNPGDNMQQSAREDGTSLPVTGDKLSITLKAETPYSSEGIAMKDRPLLTDGILQVIHGPNRFAQYLGIEATGDYDSIYVKPGTHSLSELKQKPYLHVVNFSDFQMDAFSGHFGGEIRLAFLYDGEKITPVTGGSVNGSIFDCQQNMLLSSEEIEEENYKGAKAICLENIPVAGI